MNTSLLWIVASYVVAMVVLDVHDVGVDKLDTHKTSIATVYIASKDTHSCHKRHGKEGVIRVFPVKPSLSFLGMRSQAELSLCSAHLIELTVSWRIALDGALLVVYVATPSSLFIGVHLSHHGL
jgi:hypothetical protein